MATLILVHGGFQSPAFFTPLASYLLRSGHRVLIPELPSSGTTPALPSFEADVRVVEDAVKGEIEARRDVILVMHGYGGVVGCEALKPLHGRNIETELGRVRKVVFLAGTILPIGHSTWPEDKPMPAGLELADGLITVKDAAKRFFNDIPSEAQEFWMSKLRPQSLAYVPMFPLCLVN
jgi:pimeloyl-ACP methyl ester carboxylesterase